MRKRTSSKTQMTKAKPPKKVPSSNGMKKFRLFLLSGLVFTTVFGLFLGYLTFEKSVTRGKVPPLDVTVSSSKYLSANEDETVVLGMENTDQNKVDVEFRLENKSQMSAHIGMEANNAFYLGPVSGREQVNRELRVHFPCSLGRAFDVLGQKAGLSLWGALGAKPIEKISDLPIVIGPIPWARKVFAANSAGWGLLVTFLITGLWWERVKTGGKK